MHDWSHLFKIAVGLLAIVNPIGGVPLFISATSGWPARERSKTARTVAVTVFAVLVTTLFLGNRILDFFGISTSSFLVGGGILVLLLAVSMLQARESPIRQTPEEAREASGKEAVGVVPLGIPLLAGPGAISSIIIAARHAHGKVAELFLLVIPISLISIVVWATFLLSLPIANRLGTTGINIVTRLMGLILAAMAVEFIARGIGELFPKLV